MTKRRKKDQIEEIAKTYENAMQKKQITEIMMLTEAGVSKCQMLSTSSL